MTREEERLAIAITGARRHRVTPDELSAFLDIVHELMEATGIVDYAQVTLAHGGAAGVDRYIAGIARQCGMVPVPYRPDLALDGPYPGAPCVRNGRMLDEARPMVPIAFPGETGTADCVSRAKRKEITVREICVRP